MTNQASKPENTDIAQLYVNEQKDALVKKIEVTQANDGGYYVFFHGQNMVESKAMRETVAASLPQTKLLDSSKIDKKPVLIGYTKASPEELLQQWSEVNNESFKLTQQKAPKKKTDLIKVRGNVGNIGQVLMILSGFFDSGKAGNIEKVRSRAQEVLDAKKGGRPNFMTEDVTAKDIKNAEINVKAQNFYGTVDGRAKIISASLSFFGNGMNSYYGVQKKEDGTRLEYGKRLINRALYSSDAQLPSTKDTLTKKEEKYSWMQQNSLKFSNGIKLVGKWYLSQAKDDGLSAAGKLSMASKVVTLLGKGEDSYQLEEDQSFITKLRRKSNAIAGIMEWIANITLWTSALFVKADEGETVKYKTLKDGKFEKLDGAFQYFKALIKPLFDMDKKKFRGKDGIQWFQLLGATALFGSLTAKSLAPFAVKSVDTDELSAHASEALAGGAKNKDYQADLTRLTTQLVQTWEMKEYKEQGFANVYTDIANRLAQNHQIAVHAQDNTPEASNYASNKVETAPEVSAETDLTANHASDQEHGTKPAHQRVLEDNTPAASLAAKELERQTATPEQQQAAMA